MKALTVFGYILFAMNAIAFIMLAIGAFKSSDKNNIIACFVGAIISFCHIMYIILSMSAMRDLK